MTIDQANQALHGGDIISAAKRFGIDEKRWLDLSTGINPEPYPLPDIPPQAFYQLPYLRESFKTAVTCYYGEHRFFPVAGSQMAIQALPAIIDSEAHDKILVPDVGYQEHATHWREHGSDVCSYPALYADDMVAAIDAQLSIDNACHLLIITPNNPTAVECNKRRLQEWADQLAAGFYLLVDEAFIDMQPENSLLTNEDLASNIIVLRSFGKFFGLAGIRLGFVFANTYILSALEKKLGLWQVNGPAQCIAEVALRDKQWQDQARLSIVENAQCTFQLLQPLLDNFAIEAVFDQSLFRAYMMADIQAIALHEQLGCLGILTRVIELPAGKALLRVGLMSRHQLAAVEQLVTAASILTPLEVAN